MKGKLTLQGDYSANLGINNKTDIFNNTYRFTIFLNQILARDSMPIEEVLRDPIIKTPKVEWEQRTEKSPTEVARERMREYFSGRSGNTHSAFVVYQLEDHKLNFLYRLFGISPVFEEWVYGNEGDDKTIFVTPWDIREPKKWQQSLDDYLDGAQAVHVKFLYGTNDAGNFVAERNGNTTRIGTISRR